MHDKRLDEANVRGVRARSNPGDQLFGAATSVASRPLTVIVVVTALIVSVYGALYVGSKSPPYGFYWDLGGNMIATSLIAHWISSLPDAIDSVGWAGWGNIDSFPFHPMLSVLMRLPLMPLFHEDAVTTIKFVQVLEVLVAIGSMAGLYAMLRGWSAWAWLAGLIYALLPESLLMIRGNVDFGLAIALAPLCVGVPLALARRYGCWALPLGGAIAGLLSSCLVLEFLFVQGIPAYLLAVGASYSRRNLLTWVAMAVVGLACFVLTGAYFIVPSLAMQSLFSLPVPAVANLQSGQGGGFVMFGETPVPFLALAISEFFNASVPDFSLASLLWLMLPIGIALWGLAVWRVIWAPGSGALRPGELALALMGAACAALSLGAWSPLVLLFWRVVSHVPLLNNMRTPDRLMSLAVIAVVLFAVSALEQLSLRGARARRLVVAASAIFLTAALFELHWSRLFLGDPMPLEFRFPHLQAVNSIVLQRGGRVADLGEVFLGRIGFSMLYGMSTPYNAFQDDFLQRYESDGFGGSEILARAGTRTFITTPRWATDSPYYPEPIRHSIDLKRVAGSPSTTSVWAVTYPRADVTPVNIVCLRGGPGLLEYALSLPQFERAAFVTNSSCADTVYADAAPLGPELGGKIVKTLSGISLFPRSGQMRDDDYRITLGRWFVNFPWYRNAVDGDAPQLGAAAVSLDAGDSARASIDLPQSADYEFALRMVCHAAAKGRISIDEMRDHPFACAPNLGFQWIPVELGRLERGHHFLRVAIRRIGSAHLTTTSLESSFWSVGFDGVAIVARNSHAAITPASSLFSIDRFDDVPTGPPPSKAAVAAAARANLFPNANFTLGKRSGIVPRFWSPYRDGSAFRSRVAQEYSVDRTAPPSIGTSVRIALASTVTGSAGLDTRPMPLKANTLYTVTFIARASVPNTDFLTASSSGGVMIVPTVGFGTAHADVAWHQYSFDWLVGPKDVDTSITLRTSRAYDDDAAPQGVLTKIWFAAPHLTMDVDQMHDFKALRWIGAGTYRVQTRLLGGAPGGEVSIDGKRLHNDDHVTIARSGIHRISYIGVPQDAYAIALTPSSWTTTLRSTPRVSVEKLTRQRWRVAIEQPTTLEAAVFPDGWWSLRGNAGAIAGERCDIVNTCFRNVPPGTYLLAHAWPNYVTLGLATTLAGWIVAILTFLWAKRKSGGAVAQAG